MENDVNDDQLELDPEVEEGTEQEQPDEGTDEGEERTPEQRLADAEAYAAKFKAFESIVDQLDKDPAKILDVRAALAGQAPSAREPERRTTEAPPPPQPKKWQTAEGRAELNKKLHDAAIDPEADVVGEILNLADEVAQHRISEFGAGMGGYAATVAGDFIRTFVADKKDEEVPELFDAAKKIFNDEIKDVNRAQMMSLPAEVRERELNYRWDAAVARAARPRLKGRRAPSSAGRGNNLASSQRQPREKVMELTDNQKKTLIRQLGAAEGKKAIQEIEYGR